MSLPSLTISAAPLHLFNIYNPLNSDLALTDLNNWLSDSPCLNNTVWAGDFNKHHPLWSGHDAPDHCQHSNCDLLLQLLLHHDLALRLPPGTLMYQSDCHDT